MQGRRSGARVARPSPSAAASHANVSAARHALPPRRALA